MISVSKNYFKNRNIYRLKFLKIGTFRFLEVLNVSRYAFQGNQKFNLKTGKNAFKYHLDNYR